MELYHGSPYKFEQFDLSKVGTGAERGSFGFGFYFIDNSEESIRHTKENTIGKEYFLYTVKVLNSDDIVGLDGEINPAPILKRMERVCSDDLNEFQEEYENYGMTYKQVYDYLSVVLGGQDHASKFFNDINITGFKTTSGFYDGDIYLIFSPSNLKIITREKIF